MFIPITPTSSYRENIGEWSVKKAAKTGFFTDSCKTLDMKK